MTSIVVTDRDRDWRFAPDDAELLSRRWWAIVRARLVDETTGEPPRVPVRLHLTPATLFPRVTDDGVIGVVGRPWLVRSPLQGASVDVELKVAADGFLPLTIASAVPFDRRQLTAAAAAGATVLALDSVMGVQLGERLLLGPAGGGEEVVSVATLGPSANEVTLRGPLTFLHPAGAVVARDTFAPLDLGDRVLHRDPVVIRGRTMRRTAGGLVPVPNAAVRITAVWRRPPPSVGGVPPEAAALVALEPPLGADWTATAGLMTLRDLPPLAAAGTKQLMVASRAGARAIQLSDQAGLAVGDILIVDAASGERVEFVAIQSLAGGVTAAEPVAATLMQSLVYPHARDALVNRADPQAAGAVKRLMIDARVGDSCLFVSDDTGLVGVREMELSEGGVTPPPFAYHRAQPFAVTSDAEGVYRLPPLSRIGQLTLRAHVSGLTDVTATVVPDYAVRENRLDLVFH